MNKLDYNGREWAAMREHDHGFVSVHMSDATFQRHVRAYLKRLGLPTQTYSELMEWVRQISEQRFQATQPLHELDYWLDCRDPEVRVICYLLVKNGEKL